MIVRSLPYVSCLLGVASTPVDNRPIANAWSFFGLIVSLLLVFFLVVTLLVILRRHRRARRSIKATKTASPVDPWQEAGQRAQPFPSARKKSD